MNYSDNNYNQTNQEDSERKTSFKSECLETLALSCVGFVVGAALGTAAGGAWNLIEYVFY